MLAQSRAKADSLQPSKLASEVTKQAETIDALKKNIASWQTALRSRVAIIVEMNKSIVSQAASNSVAIAKVRWLEERMRAAHEDLRLRDRYIGSLELHIQAAEGAIQGSVGSASADRSMLEDLSTSRAIAANVTGPSSVSILELAESNSAAPGTQIEDSGPKTTTEQPGGMSLIEYHHPFADVDFVTPPNPTHTSSGSESYTDPDSVTTSWTEASFEFEFDDESSAATSSPAFQATVEVLYDPINNEGSGAVPALVSEVPGETSQKRARESDTPELSRKLIKSGSNPEVHVESVVASSSSPLGTEDESASTAPTSSPEVGETLAQIGHTFITDTKKAAERLSLLVDSAEKFNFLFFETTALVNFLNDEILRKSSVSKRWDLAGRDAVRAEGERLAELHRLIGETKTIFQAATR
jgi:hypothetical protein